MNEVAISSEAALECLHCGLPVGRGAEFCCSGCRAVYATIHGLGLSQFYEYRKRLPGDTKRAASPLLTPFSHFDDPAFFDAYVSGGPVKSVEFFLDGMHCAACVWLVEKLPALVPGVLEARANFAARSVVVRFDPAQVKLSRAARQLDSLGYTPHPLRQGADKSEARRELLRIGLAAVSAGNSMMFAVSLYQGWFSGMEDAYSAFLCKVSFAVTLPAVLYSALPFYRAALGGIRARLMHIDLPISAAVLLAFAASTYNTFVQSGHVYYDSISMLIFLLLGARWVQRRGVAQASRETDLLAALVPLSVRKIDGESNIEEIYIGSIAAGDRLEVREGEIIPCDGTVEAGSGEISLAVLTGESVPVQRRSGDEVYAGTKLLSGELKVLSGCAFSQTRIGGVLQLVKEGERQKARIAEVTDRLSRYFVVSIVFLALICAVFWFLKAGAGAAFNNTLALLVISCPCALGLAAPLALSVAVRKAARIGIMVRSATAIERLAAAQKIFLDKTGTLTQGRAEVRKQLIVLNREEVLAGICGLEKGSRHHAGAAVFRFAAAAPDSAQPDFSRTEVYPGMGIAATAANGAVWRAGSWNWMEEFLPGLNSFSAFRAELLSGVLTPVIVGRDDEVAAIFGVGDEIRPGIRQLVEELNRSGTELALLSGDAPEIVSAVAAQCGIREAAGNCAPDEKAGIISRAGVPSVMVGDGANDAAALKAAGAGVGVSGGAEACMRIADVFVVHPEAETLSQLFSGARRTMRIIRLNLAASVLYNVFGAAAALLGLMNPLIAAVLMPVSSLTVVATSAFGRTFDGTAKRERWT